MEVGERKNIDAIVKYFYPVAAGIETNMLETYSILAARGWNVTIHTSNLDYATQELLKDKEKIRNLKVIRYKFSRLGFFPNINFNKANLVSLHNFDIFPHFWILSYSFLLKLLGKKKFALVLTPHGGFNPEWSIFPIWQTIIKYLYHYTLGTFLVNAAVDGVRAVSDWEKEMLVKKGIKSQKIRVIANGIENEAFVNVEKLASRETKNKVKNFGRYIIQIGRIYPIKNYETTIKALPYLPSDIKYVIVGPIADNKYYNVLKELAQNLGVGGRVIFFGVVRGADKYYLIKNAETMVHMAIWESFCNVVHEGLSQGLICIVANNTALPFLVRDNINGYCVDTHDSEGLARKINFVLENKGTKFLRQMSERNRKNTLEESWINVAARMDAFYKQLVRI